MNSSELNFFFGTKSSPSKYDSMNFNNLLKHIFHADFFEENLLDYFQAYQNKFSKILSIPTIKLTLKSIDFAGLFCFRRTTKPIQNVKIKLDTDLDLTEAIFTIPHEVKHSEQAYNFHKFCKYNVIPKDNLGKAILILDIIGEFDNYYTKNTEYYSRLDELDAMIFSINQTEYLMKKYPLFNNIDFNLFLRTSIFSILYNLKYNFDGIQNSKLKNSMQNLQYQIVWALKGYFGEPCKNAIQQILNSGFNIEKAFETITSNLDKYSSSIILENHMFNKLGASYINLSTNGELNYKPDDGTPAETVIDDNVLDESLEYSQFIKKYICNNNLEFDKMVYQFLEEARNSNNSKS